MTTPFLRQVAIEYHRHEADRLIDYCFVFPNKRAGLFFAEHIAQLSGRPATLPAVTTISELVMELSGGVEASRLEQLMALYDVYRQILAQRGRAEEAADFDRFQYWGDIILNDFNDVDRYMVDPRQLFTNINDLKEIASNYLTAEQLSVIREYWGEVGDPEAVDNFWRHFNHGEGDALSTRFIKLWQILYDIYVQFGQCLDSLGLTYSGRAYREAVNTLKEMSADELPYKRYVFVGFNVLSTSETRMFELLQRKGAADFYWDYASPAFANPSNKATRFLRRYIKRFQPLYPLPATGQAEWGEIHIEGIPSDIGQVKRAGAILKELADSGVVSAQALTPETAVVLPDENLFIPLLHSIPQEISNVNITMGVPLRHSPVSALMTNIVTMQSKSRTLHGEITYYYQHVYSVLSHPILRTLCPKECQGIVDTINRESIYNLSADLVCREWPGLAPVFRAVKDCANPEEVYAYAEELTTWLRHGVEQLGADPVELGFIARYHEGVVMLRRLARRYRVTMNDNTFFHLLERLMASESINFVGEPLSGLQIMGVLETRALDFDNIIMLSMNERVFPRKHYAPTFIPNNLRRGYGMATIEFQESIYSYYFYRLIARAKRVYLLYDTRSEGLRSGEMSRFLYQLRYLYPHDKLHECVRSYSATPLDKRELAINKTPRVMEILNRYRDPNAEHKHNLSPSAIDHYIRCPLQFYLEYVEGYRVSDELLDYMDEGTYGNILHEVADNLYESLRAPGEEEVPVTAERLKSLLQNKAPIEREITRVINSKFLRLGDDCYTPLKGENLLIGQMMLRYIELMLRREMEQGPYRFIDGEMKVEIPLRVDDDLTINYKGIIDRVDRLPDGTIRLVDYKTGADDIKVSNWEQVFETGNHSHQKCFLQLFLYCNAYAQHTGYTGPILPMVYRLRKIAVNPIENMKIAKDAITDYREFNDEYMSRLSERLHELFDPAVPFYPSPDDNACKYCKFTNICDRQ